MKKKLLLALIAVVNCLSMQALTFTQDRLKYQTIEGTARQVAVIGFADNVSAYYQRYLYVDSVVTYNGMRYKVFRIEDNAFKNNTNIIDIYLKGSELGIGAHAFQGCTGLLNTNLMSSDLGAVMIDDYAFEGCTSLRAVGLPQQLIYLGQYAFGNCTNLKSVSFRTTYEIEANAFEGSPIEILSWENPYSNMTVNGGVAGQSPLYNLRFTVKKVYLSISAPARLFYQFPNLEEVEVYGDNVKTIGNEAFFRCPKLHRVSLWNSDNLQSIGDWAFGYCPIDTLYWSLHQNLYSIGEGAFYGFQEDGLNLDCGSSSRKATIGANAFGGNTHLQQLRIYGHYESIDKDAFNGSTCSELRINPSSFPTSDFASKGDSPYTRLSGLTTLDYWVSSVSSPRVPAHAFEDISTLQNVNLSKVTEIGESAFRNTALTSVALPDTLQTIGTRAFAGTQITKVTIPEGVTQLGYSIFGTTLTELHYNATNATYIGGTNTTAGIFQVQGTITIGGNVTDIPARFSVNAQDLHYIAFPGSVVRIGNYAFYNNGNMSSVALPVNVQSIGSSAFGSCTRLKTLTISGNVPDPNGALTGTTLTTIYCNCNNETQVQNLWTSVCSNIVSEGTADYELPAMNESMMAGRGTVTWSAQQGCDPNRTATAVPEDGYTFVRWSDGVTTAARTINLQTWHSDFRLYAIFAQPGDYTTLTVNVQPAGGAYITFSDPDGYSHSGGKYLLELGDATAVITPNIKDADYEFVSWSYDSQYDGAVVEDPQTHVLTVSLMVMDGMDGPEYQFPRNYTLILKEKIKVGARSADPAKGSVQCVDNGDGSWDIFAVTKTGYVFEGWDDNEDGIIDNTTRLRTVNPTQSTTYVAYFKDYVRTYTVHVVHRGSGTVEVSRLESDEMMEIPEGETVTLQAVLGENTILKGWYDSDGGTLLSTSNPFVIEAIDRFYDPVYIETEWVDPAENSWMASVQVEPYGAGTVTSNVAMTDEGGTYSCYVPQNFNWTLTAVPNPGYAFDNWMYMVGEEKSGQGDEVTANPLTIAVPALQEFNIINVVAVFREAQGVDEVPSDRVQGTKLLRNGVLLIRVGGEEYNAQGKMIR